MNATISILQQVQDATSKIQEANGSEEIIQNSSLITMLSQLQELLNTD